MLVLMVMTHALLGAAGPRSGVYLWGQLVPTEVLLGDVVYMEISIHNRGDRPVRIPASAGLETGTLGIEIYDFKEHTRFYFFSPAGCPAGFDVPEVLLPPGKSRVLCRQMLPVPSFECFAWRFWDPKKWRDGDYYLDLRCGRFKGRSEAIGIRRRPEAEMQALLEYYDGGFKSPIPRGWDIDRPTLATFGLLSFPTARSLPDELARMKEKLSPGTLRDIFHLTRLTAALYDAPSLWRKRQAMDRLFRWLDARPEIQRRSLAGDLYTWSSHSRGLGTFGYELVDEAIRRLPERIGQEGEAERRLRRQYLIDHPEADKYWKKPKMTAIQPPVDALEAKKVTATKSPDAGLFQAECGPAAQARGSL
ncbi:MAG TPA: hypothetical protein EYH34_03405 [Planctomycetes bacterium]|nr:hypothetical protein [Planctomycetota bacterium]